MTQKAVTLGPCLPLTEYRDSAVAILGNTQSLQYGPTEQYNNKKKKYLRGSSLKIEQKLKSETAANYSQQPAKAANDYRICSRNPHIDLNLAKLCWSLRPEAK